MKKIVLGVLAVCFIFAMLGCDPGVIDVYTTPVTISFDLHYDGAPAGPAKFTLEYGNAIGRRLPAAPSVAPAGYYFVGWFWYDRGGWEEVKETTTFKMNTTIYARWALIADVTVSFDLNYTFCPAPPASVTIKNNEAIGDNLPAAPANEVYDYSEFQGWGRTRFGEIVDATATFPADSTLYAVWADTREDITITYDWNIDPTPPTRKPAAVPPVTIKKGAMITGSNLPYINWGWNLRRFKGWSAVSADDGELVSRTTTFATDTVLYAQYTLYEGIVLDLKTDVGSNLASDATTNTSGGIVTGGTFTAGGTVTRQWTRVTDEDSPDFGSATISFNGGDYAFIKLSNAQRNSVVTYWNTLGSTNNDKSLYPRTLRIIIDGDYINDEWEDPNSENQFRYFFARTGATSNWNGSSTAYATWPNLVDAYRGFASTASNTAGANGQLQFFTIMKSGAPPGKLQLRSIVIIFTKDMSL